MRMLMNTKRYKDVSVCIGKCNVVFASNGGGKTLFCDEVVEGFQGGLKKSFVVNGNEVVKGDYFVFKIGEGDSLENERLLGTKSVVRQQIESEIRGLSDEVKREVDDKLEELRGLISSIVYEEIELLDKMKLDTTITLKDLLVKHTAILYDSLAISDLSFSEKRKQFIYMYVDMIERMEDACVLVVDSFDLGLSDYERNRLFKRLKRLSEERDCIVIVSTARSMDCEYGLYVNEESVEDRLLDTTRVVEYLAVDRGELLDDFKKYYSSEEIEEWVQKYHLYEKGLQAFLGDPKFIESYGYLLKSGLISCRM